MAAPRGGPGPSPWSAPARGAGRWPPAGPRPGWRRGSRRVLPIDPHVLVAEVAPERRGPSGAGAERDPDEDLPLLHGLGAGGRVEPGRDRAPLDDRHPAQRRVHVRWAEPRAARA